SSLPSTSFASIRGSPITLVSSSIVSPAVQSTSHFESKPLSSHSPSSVPVVISPPKTGSPASSSPIEFYKRHQITSTSPNSIAHVSPYSPVVGCQISPPLSESMPYFEIEVINTG